MTYRVARGGDVIGSYTLLHLQRDMASGALRASDLAQMDGMDEWIPLSELFPASSAREERSAPRLYRNPPDLQWWAALLLGVVTLGIFFVVWDVVLAAWLRRVEQRSWAFMLYAVALVVFIANLPAQWASINHALLNGPPVESQLAVWLPMVAFGLRLVARLMMRGDLQRHFTVSEPMELQWSLGWTLLFGGLYFQYRFNEINRLKRKLRISVPTE